MEHTVRWYFLNNILFFFAAIVNTQVCSILFNICDLGPPKKEPSANTDNEGSVTSSIKYNSLKEGKAINTKIKAGVIVHTSSISVP